jgi:hypothetical protein
VAGSCEHGNKLLCSINGEKILDQMSNYHILNNGSICAYLHQFLSFMSIFVSMRLIPLIKGKVVPVLN